MIWAWDEVEQDQQSRDLASKYDIPFLSTRNVLKQTTPAGTEQVHISQLYWFVHMIMRDIWLLHYQQKFGNDLEKSMIKLRKT